MKENSDQRIFENISAFRTIDDLTLLEIGCGDGRISKFLAKKTDHLIGIDPDEKRIRTAQDNIPRAFFLAGSGEHLGFTNDYFDLVIFTLSLHHQDSRKALEEAERVLKKDGLILVIEPLAKGEVERAFAIVHNEDQAKFDARQAILESKLRVQRSQEFCAQWYFDGKQDVAASLFSFYDLPYDAVLAQHIYDFLGAKAQNDPIELSDSMIIQALSKNAPSGA